MFKKTIFNRKILIFILFLAFIFSSSSIMAVEDLEALLTEDLKIPTEIEDLIAKFSQLDYQTTIIENGNKTFEGINYYSYLGKEEIRGEITDKISLEIKAVDQEANLMIFWLSDNEFKQAQIQGEIIPGAMVNMMGESLLQGVFAPFYNILEYDLKEFARMGEVSKNQQLIGNREIEVITITVEDLPQEELKSGTVQLANLDNFLMIVSYNFISDVEDYEAEFILLNFELH